MNKLHKVVSNTIISLLGQAVTWTSTLLLTMAYGRFLGDVKFGELYFATNFVLLVGFPLEFGFNQQLIREVAQEPDKAVLYLSNTLIIKGCLWFILYGLVLLLSWFLGYNQDVHILIAVCGLSLLSSSTVTTFASSHYALGRVTFPAIGMILEKGLSALVGYVLLQSGLGVQWMAVILLVCSIANGIWQAFWFFRLVGLGFVIDLALIRELVRVSVPFFVSGALGVIYYRIDSILLSFMAGPAVVGWYGAGYRLFDTMVFLPSIIINPIMYPLFSKLSTTSQEELKLAIEKSMTFLLFFGIPIATGLIVAAPNIIAFLYPGPDFTPAYLSLQALAPGLIFLYINTVFSSTLLSIKKERKTTLMAAIALVFNLGLNLVLIPRYEHIGAAIVTSLTELLLLCLAVTFIPRPLLPLRSLIVGAKALLASLIMALVIWALRTLSIFEILPVAMLVYFSAAMLLRTIPRADLAALYMAIRHKAQPASPGENVHPDETELRYMMFVDQDTITMMPLIVWKKETVPMAVPSTITSNRLGWTTTTLLAMRPTHQMPHIQEASKRKNLRSDMQNKSKLRRISLKPFTGSQKTE